MFSRDVLKIAIVVAAVVVVGVALVILTDSFEVNAYVNNLLETKSPGESQSQ